MKQTLLEAINKARLKEAEAKSVTAEYKPNRSGEYELFCEIAETGIPFFSFSLTLPTLDSAKTAAAKFRKNAEKIYSEIIKDLT